MLGFVLNLDLCNNEPGVLAKQFIDFPSQSTVVCYVSYLL